MSLRKIYKNLTKNPSVHRRLAKSVANRKMRSGFILDIFEISWQPSLKFLGNQGELERTETTKNFC